MTRIIESRPGRWLAAASLALGLTAWLPGAALADERCEEDAQGEEGSRNYRTEIGPDGRKVFVIERAFVVCGRVPKPNVIYVLQASTINYEWETLKRDFLPKVIDSVKKAPF